MARNKQQMIFEVNGDVSGLRKALSEGTQSIQKFGTESEDLFGGFTKSITDITSRLSGFNTGLVGTAGAVGLLAGGIFSLVSSSNDYVKTYNEVAKTSSLTVTQLQQLEKTFQGVAFETEKWGDLNRNVLDHLGDAFRDGSGPAEDMKAYGIEIKNFNQYLNQTDGGIRSLAEAFYEMRKAGKSTAEITNMLETLGSDGSKLISVFNQYSNNVDLMNAVQSQHVLLTEDTAAKYAEFDKQVNQLSTSFQLWKANALGPTIDDIQTLFDWFNKDWSGTDFVNMARNIWYGGGENSIGALFRKLDGVDPATIFGTKEWNKAHADNQFPPKPSGQAGNSATPQGGWEDADKKRKEAEAAAKKAEAEAKARAAKVAQAQIQWDNAVSRNGLTQGEIQLKAFNRQQDEILAKIKTSGETLKKSQFEIDNAVNLANASRQQQLNTMIESMLGLESTNKELQDLSNNIAAVGTQLTDLQAKQLQKQQNERIGIEGQGDEASNPFNNQNVLDQKRKDLEAQRALELQMNEQTSRQLNLSQEQYQKRKNAIMDAYNKKALTMTMENTQSQIVVLRESAGSLGTILSGAFGEGSKAAKAAYMVQKGLQMSSIVISIQEALAKAMSLGFPASIPAYAQVLSLGASIISTAKGAASGKAHSGMDSVPDFDGTGESTWILKKGERVVQPEQNKKLTQFLDSQTGSNTNSGGQTVVNAPLIIQGDSANDDAKFQAMLKKHQNSVTQAVKNAQARTT